MMQQLTRKYFEEQDVVDLAKDLLGKLLFTEFDGVVTSGWITETEAYRAPEDKASHAYNNRRTRRTECMFGPGGRAYIYLNYGIHHLFNVVSGPRELPHAVLVRAILPFENASLQLKRRRKRGDCSDPKFYDGPGKLSQALAIHTDQNGIDLCASDSPIRIYDIGTSIADEEILCGPRVGIDYAEEWKDLPWRFQWDGSSL
jgi:DNA-3-methyladenine glycosylase